MINSNAYIWTFVGKFGNQAVNLLLTMVLARLLTPESFGTIGVLSIIFVVANIFIESGLGGALIMEKELNKRNCGTIFFFNIIISFTLYIIIYFLAPYIENFYDIKGLATITRILSLVFVINSFGIVPTSIMYYKLKFKVLTIINLNATIFAAILSIILAIMGAEVYSLVGFQLSVCLINVVCLSIINKEYFSICFDKSAFKRMYSFGLYTTISNIVDSIYENSIVAFFGKTLGVTEAGYISQSKKIEEASSQSLMTTINSAVYPILSKIKDDIEKFRVESSELMRNIPLFISPIIILLGVFSKEMIFIMLGNQWIHTSTYLSLFAVAGFFMILDTINRNFIKSLGKVNILFYITIFKRLLCFLIIIVIACIEPNYIIHAYVLGAFLGFICNHYMFIKLVGYIPIKSFIMLFINLLPILLLTVVIQVIYISFDSLLMKIIITIGTLILYYFVLLPVLGLPINQKVKSIVQKILLKKILIL